MPRKLNKRKKVQAIKRKAGLAPPAHKSIYDRPVEHGRLSQPFTSLRDMMTVYIGEERNW